MGVHIGDNNLVIATKSKPFHIDLPKDVGISLKHGTYSIMKLIMNF